MGYFPISYDSQGRLSTATRNYVSRSSGVYTEDGKYCGEMVNERELRTMSHYRDINFREFFQNNLAEKKPVDEVYSSVQSNKIQWICKEAHNCPQETCYHVHPHEWDEDCHGEAQCPRGIVVDGCCRVGGPKHKQISEGRCKDLWED